jgi:hypothetical protein
VAVLVVAVDLAVAAPAAEPGQVVGAVSVAELVAAEKRLLESGSPHRRS